MTECLCNYINVGNDRQFITIESINNRKIYLLYKIGEQSLHTIMSWLINVCKYKCDQYESMSNFKFSQNGKILETTNDYEVTKNLLNDNPILKLNLVTNPHQFNYWQFELDNSKFVVNSQTIVIYIKTLNGKSIMINVNPKITKVGELKLKIQIMEGIPPEQQRFIFNGRQLEDGLYLSDYYVDNECSFQLVLRLHGGMYNEVSGRNGQYEQLTNIFYDISHYKL
jgi:ubiquitin